MNLSDMPTRVPIPFGNSAGAGYIRSVPVPSQIGVLAGAASFTDGFTPDTFTPLSGGGAYVNGEDMNGVLNHVTKWTRWQTAGGPAVYNSTFATAVGGYPKGATLVSSALGGRVWMNTVDGNLTDPDGSSAVGWVPVGPVASTLAQAEAGTDDTTFITPLVLAEYQATVTRTYGQNANGYWMKDLLTGVITQWGHLSGSGGTYNFPIPFVNGCTGFQTNRSTQEGYADVPWGRPLTLSTFTAGTKDVNGGFTGYELWWEARGT